jgi:hypothetical protein
VLCIFVFTFSNVLFCDYFSGIMMLFYSFAGSVISGIQRDHMESIEKLVPDLASLRGRLCPSYMDEDIFWKIYFRLLESNINEHSSEVCSFSVYHSLVAYI